MGKKSEAYFEPTKYNREGWCFYIWDVNNSKKKCQNRKQKQHLIAKKNIKLKK